MKYLNSTVILLFLCVSKSLQMQHHHIRTPLIRSLLLFIAAISHIHPFFAIIQVL